MKITAKCIACKETVEPILEYGSAGIIATCPKCKLIIKKIPYEDHSQTKSKVGK